MSLPSRVKECEKILKDIQHGLQRASSYDKKQASLFTSRLERLHEVCSFSDELKRWTAAEIIVWQRSMARAAALTLTEAKTAHCWGEFSMYPNASEYAKRDPLRSDATICDVEFARASSCLLMDSKDSILEKFVEPSLKELREHWMPHVSVGDMPLERDE